MSSADKEIAQPEGESGDEAPIGGETDELIVIVISAGAPPTLVDTVLSLVNQVPRPPVVVVNSGGGGVKERLAPLADAVTILDSERPLSLGGARNRGLEATTAPFIAFLPAGYAASPGWVAARLRHHRRGADAVVGEGLAAGRGAEMARTTHIVIDTPHLELETSSITRRLWETCGPFREDLPSGEATYLLRRQSTNVRVIRDATIAVAPAPRSFRDCISAAGRGGFEAGYFHWGSLRERLLARTGRHFVAALRTGMLAAGVRFVLSQGLVLMLLIAAYELNLRKAAQLRNLARSAASQGRYDAALVAFRALWERTGDVQPITAAIQILLAQGRANDAVRKVQLTGHVSVPERTHLLAALAYHRARFDWPSIIALVERHSSYLTREIEVAAVYMHACAAEGRTERALDPVAAYRGHDRQNAAALMIETLLRCGLCNDAITRFRKMPALHRAQLPNHVIGPLIVATTRQEGPDAAGALLHDAVPPQRLGAPSERDFSAAFYRARLDCHLHILEKDAPTPSQSKPMEDQLLTMARGHRRPGDVLVQMCDGFAQLRATHDAFYPDPSFVLGDALALARRIDDAVRRQEPFSLIRLGDGEGNVLPYRQQWRAFERPDFRSTVRAWWGDEAMPDRDMLRTLLIEAIEKADVVGIPDLQRLSSGIAHHKNVRGLTACTDAVLDLRRRLPSVFARQLISSCHLHQSLAYWDLWEILVPRMREVSLITCHEGLAKTITDRFGVSVGDIHLIPAERKYHGAFKATASLRHFPERFGELRASLASPQQGRIYLVAAGILGKVYCTDIKRHGGIAIDIGSIADEWAGFQTRSLEEISNYWRPGHLAEQMAELLDGVRDHRPEARSSRSFSSSA